MDADTIDRVMLMTSKTGTIEKTQQRYIDNLEKKIAAIEAELNLKALQTSTKTSVPGSELGPEQPKIVEEGINQSIKLTTNTSNDASSPPHSPTDSIKAPDSSQQTKSTTKDDHWPDVRFQERRWKNNEKEIKDATPGQTESAQLKSSDKAITCLKKYDPDDRYKYTQLEIHNKALRALVQTALAHCLYVGLDVDPEATMTLYSPYEVLIHNWTLLEALAGDDDNNTLVIELKETLSLINSPSGSETAQWPENVKVFAKDESMVKQARQKLGILLDVAKTESKVLKPYFAEHKDLGKDMINYDYLWTVFRPGDIVVSETVFKEKQAFIVNSSLCPWADSDNQENGCFRLICWAYDFDGSTFKRIPVRFEISWFKGTKSITTLPVYPVRCLPAEERKELEIFLQERGAQFRELCLKGREKRMFKYSIDKDKRQPLNEGSSMDSRETSKSQSARLEYIEAIDRGLSLRFEKSSNWYTSLLHGEHKKGRGSVTPVQIRDGDPVIVDFETFLLHNPDPSPGLYPPIGELQFSELIDDCYCGICRANQFLRDNQKVEYDLDPFRNTDAFKDPQYQLCPPRVLGFHLRDKRWVELKVSNLKTMKGKITEADWSKLEVPLKQKNLVRDLVRSHTSGRKSKENQYMEDLTKGKGEGLVIMLYGPPGVGKTLTAEIVAQATQKPLLQLDASDIGSSPADVEKNMKKLFDLGAAWQAVMLFDEADVFLEARSEERWDRNAAVAALLRILEYYDGILILTSNRLKTVDHAMLSRIHLSIKYEVLNGKQKQNIFTNLIMQLPSDKIEEQDEILKWMKDDDTQKLFRDLNGRQIRNILFSAATLASGDGGNRKLKRKDIEQLTKSTSEFAADLKSTLAIARARAEPNMRTND